MTTIKGTGTSLGFDEINSALGRGTDMASYKGTTWYKDDGSVGTFASSNLSFNDFYSKRPDSPTFVKTISANQNQLNLRTWAAANGWNGSSAVVITLDSGYYIYSTNTGVPALTINGSWPNGITFINNGVIVGAGGAGGNGAVPNVTGPVAGGAGGIGLSLGVSIKLTNNGGIYGGGGGGGGGATYSWGTGGAAGGGGGGGAGLGAGGTTNGGAGSLTSGGAGGTNKSVGGNGGGYNAAGSAGGSYTYASLSQWITSTGAPGGSAGTAIATNGYTIS